MFERKQLIRIANRIEDLLQQTQHHRHSELLSRLSHLENEMRNLTAWKRKLDLAIHRRWHAAADRCRECIHQKLYDLPYGVSRVQELAQERSIELPTASFLIEELRQIEQEFGGFQYDSRSGLLGVTTEPIDLEGVYLGSFEIQLELERLPNVPRLSPYVVVATDPHPAASNDAVTHPHVSNGGLCEGDGHAAIRAALQQGRLCDFFTLVKNILTTYNADNAYVSLDEWYGAPCYDCGHVADENDLYGCEFCRNSFCEECSSTCHGCDTTGCLSCLGTCPVCNERTCSDCLGGCENCAQTCCISCLEEGLCPECKTEKEKNDEQESEETERTEQGEQAEQTEQVEPTETTRMAG